MIRNKYYARKCCLDGIEFDSNHEMQRYAQLKMLQRAGKISDLKLQVSFELVPRQDNICGKMLERPVRYIADFVYKDEAGNTVVEDAKGKRTKEYIIKRKLMLYKYRIRIREV